MKELKLVIAIPSMTTWSAHFGMCLASMMMVMNRPFQGYTSPQIALHNKRGSILPANREKMLEDAIKQGATHVLFIDSDQTFPEGTAHALLAADKSIIAANVATKGRPSYPTARKDDKVVFSTGKHGVQRVDFIGTGIMLIDLSVVKDLPKPWFNIHWVPELGTFMGEDWGFCERLRQAGIPIHIHHDLSNAVGHVGEEMFLMEDTENALGSVQGK